MQRSDILAALLPSGYFPLWTPLLTRYRSNRGGQGRPGIDAAAMRAHAHGLAPDSASWMIAGSTGDGWDLEDAQMRELLATALEPGFAPEGARLLLALLRPTTGGVLELVEMVHELLGTRSTAPLAENLERLRERRVVGLCICPPVSATVDQAGIALHVEAVLAQARMPVALYQLPQVTGCRIEPETFDELVASHEEIVLFKDSSGEDRVANETHVTRGPLMVRGAESRYAHSLRALGGEYDGLLLSTANVFAPELRALVRDALSGKDEKATGLSNRLEARVEALFATAGEQRVGNAFANVNRAADHVLRNGEGWREMPSPPLFDGSRLDPALLERVAAVLDRMSADTQKL